MINSNFSTQNSYRQKSPRSTTLNSKNYNFRQYKHSSNIAFNGNISSNKRKIMGFLGSVIMSINLAGCSTYQKANDDAIINLLGKTAAKEFFDTAAKQRTTINKNELELINTYNETINKNAKEQFTKADIEALYEKAKKKCQSYHYSKVDHYDTKITTEYNILTQMMDTKTTNDPVYKYYEKTTIEPLIEIEVTKSSKDKDSIQGARYKISSYGKEKK